MPALPHRTTGSLSMIFGGLLLPLLFLTGCGRVRTDLDYDHAVQQQWIMENPAVQIAQFESVDFRPLDIELLHAKVREGQLVDSRSLLEIGTGTGYFAIVCALEGAHRVVALADDRTSAACARYNVAVAKLDATVEVRSLSGGDANAAEPSGVPEQTAAPAKAAFQNVLQQSERFDFVLLGSQSLPTNDLLQGVIEDLPTRLTAGGHGWVICRDEQTEQTVRDLCRSLGFDVSEVTAKEAATPSPVSPVYLRILQIDPFAVARPVQPDNTTPPAEAPLPDDHALPEVAPLPEASAHR